MKDERTPEEKAFIERLDAVCEDTGEKDLRQEHWGRGEPLIIGRNGVAMLKYADGRITPLDGE